MFNELWRARCRICGNADQQVEVDAEQKRLTGPQECGQCGRNMQATAWGCDLMEFIRPLIPASDGAIALAAEHGIDLTTLAGTGAEGRIIKADVQAAIKEGQRAISD